MTSSTAASLTRRTHGATLIGATLIVGFGGMVPTPAWAGGTTSTEQAATLQTIGGSHQSARATDPVSTRVRRAEKALERAVSRLAEGRRGRAVDDLEKVQRRLRHAHRAARDLIGRPPSDPESDEPPGPPAVLAVLGLEHRIGTTVVPLFDGRPRADVSDALNHVLRSAHRRRDVMLDLVIGAGRGEGDPYADGMADTLGTYKKEVEQLRSALATSQLTTVDRARLRDALTRVTRTRAKVEAAYGGGELVSHGSASAATDLRGSDEGQLEVRS